VANFRIIENPLEEFEDFDDFPCFFDGTVFIAAGTLLDRDPAPKFVATAGVSPTLLLIPGLFK